MQTTIGYSAQLFNVTREGEGEDWLCIFAGFIITCTSLSSIYHLVSLTIERYCSIVHALGPHQFLSKPKNAIYFLAPAWLQALFWAGVPLLGWGGYNREPLSKHRCSVVSPIKKTLSLSYSYSMMAFDYFLPILVIIFCCSSVQIEIRKMSEKSVNIAGNNSALTQFTQKSRTPNILSWFV